MSLDLPIVNGDNNTWGGKVNTALTDLDNRVTAAASAAGSGARTAVVIPNAVGNGTTDDTAALQAAFSQANKSWLLESGKVYRHTGNARLTLSGAGTVISGYGATISSDTPRYGGLCVTADNVTVEGLKHIVVGATARGNGENLDDSPFCVDNCANTTLRDVESVGSRDAGMFINLARGARIISPVIRDSFADGLHFSNGSRDCTAWNPVCINNGDDGVAIVGYLNEANPCRNIRVFRPHVFRGAARGVTILGGDNCHMVDIEVKSCRGAGIYMGSESNNDYTTKPTTNCSVRGGKITEANFGNPGLDNGAIFFINQNNGTTCDTMLVSDVQILDQFSYLLVKNSGGTGRFNNCEYRDITILGDYNAPAPLYVDGVSSTTTTAGPTGSGFTYLNANLDNAGGTSSGNGFKATRVAVGGRWADGSTSGGTTSTSSTPAAVSARRVLNGDISLPVGGGSVPITGNSYKTDIAMYDPADGIKATVSGIYIITSSVLGKALPAGTILDTIVSYVRGSTTTGVGESNQETSLTGDLRTTATFPIPLLAGDIIKLAIYSNAAITIGGGGAPPNTYLTLSLLGTGTG